MRELSDEEKYVIEKYANESIKEFAKSKTDELARIPITKVKTYQALAEAGCSFAFTDIRLAITLIICLIFLVVDCKILAFVWKADLTTLIVSENLTIVKYGFLFLVSQLVIFSQGFGFSSIVKLIERFSSKKNAKEKTKEENQ